MIGPRGKRTLFAILLIISFQREVEPSYSLATSAPVSNSSGGQLPLVETYLFIGSDETKKVNVTMATKIRLICNLTVQAAQEAPTTGSWEKDGKEIVKKIKIQSGQISASLSHEFDFQKGKDAGNYSCIFDTDPKSGGRFEVQIPPIWTKSESVTRSSGDQVNLTCESGQYAPLQWTWSKEVQGIKEMLSNETDTFDIHSDGNKSTLSIKNVIKDNTTYYYCDANYTVGVSTLQIYLKVHSLTAALLPFLCIVAEVLVLVIVILACEKKMKQKEEPAEDKNLSNKQTTEELLDSTENGTRHRKA